MFRDFLLPGFRRLLSSAPEPAPVPVQEPSPAPPGSDLPSRLDSISNAMTGLGGTYDKGQQARPTYPAGGLLTLDELEILYRMVPYARRGIDLLPMDMTRKPWFVQASDVSPEDANRIRTSIETWDLQMETRSKARQALIWGRLYGAGYLWPVVEDGLPLNAPLDLSRIRKVYALHVLDGKEVIPLPGMKKITDQNFREPSLYQVTPMGRNPVVGGQVHSSRLIRFPGARLPPSIYGDGPAQADDSALQVAWMAIRDRVSVDQGAANWLQSARQNILKVAGLQGLQASDRASAFRERMRLMLQSMGLLNMILLSDGEEFQTISQAITGFRDLDEHSRAALSVAFNMPQALLFGEAPSGLNTDGESWQKAWGAIVSSERQDSLGPRLETLYEIVMASQEGPTKGLIPVPWKVAFAPLQELSRKEIVELRKMAADTDLIYMQSGVLTAQEVRQSRFSSPDHEQDVVVTDSEAPTPAPAWSELAKQTQLLLDLTRQLEDDDDPETEGTEEEPSPADSPDKRGDAKPLSSYPVPRTVRANARKVIRWKKAYPDEIRGMTPIGWRRASQLANRGRVSLDVVMRMHSFFARHQENRAIAEEFTGTPWKDAGYVAWLGWGGDEGEAWVKRVIENIDRDDESDLPPWSDEAELLGRGQV